VIAGAGSAPGNLELRMRILVNGEHRDLPAGHHCSAPDPSFWPPRERLAAAEVNMELVPRREQEGRTLREGDRVEIVTLVGGG